MKRCATCDETIEMGVQCDTCRQKDVGQRPTESNIRAAQKRYVSARDKEQKAALTTLQSHWGTSTKLPTKREAKADTRVRSSLGKCRLCDQPILWERAASGKWKPPMDPETKEMHSGLCAEQTASRIKNKTFWEHTRQTHEIAFELGRQSAARHPLVTPPWEDEMYCT